MDEKNQLLDSLSSLIAAAPKGSVKASTDSESFTVSVSLKKSEVDKEAMRKIATAVIDRMI